MKNRAVRPRVAKSDYEREKISGSTRALLLTFAAGDLGRSLEPLQVDWDQVYDAVSRNGLLGLCWRYLSQAPGADASPLEFRNKVQAGYRSLSIRMALANRNIQRVLAGLIDRQADFMVLKGPALENSIYPTVGLRSYGDLDIAMRERDWKFIYRFFSDSGFTTIQGSSPEPPPKMVSQCVTYETKFWHPGLKLLVEVHYEDLLNAGFAARDAEGYWQRSVPVPVENLSVRTLALDDQILYLSAHAHYHGYTRLIWFSDLAFIVRDHASQIDWLRLIQTVKTEQAEVPVYYTLLYLAELFQVHAPESIVAAIKPDRMCLWFHKLYLPDDKVLSLQPMKRPMFSFYFLPLFERLLPDLLVMGRRREKIPYLLRLLCPPPDWLRYYYHLGGCQDIRIHYFLHPFKLLYHYLAEVFLWLGKIVPKKTIAQT